MDLYSSFKLVHVIAATAWVGGGLTLIAQAIFRIREAGPREVLEVTRNMGLLALRWFLPSSALTLLSGLLMALLGGLWTQAWIVLSLAGFAVTFLTGHFILRVRGEKVFALQTEGREHEAVQEALALIRVSKFDYAVVLMVVVLMVLKPQWNDPAFIGGIAAVIACAGFVFLLPPKRRSTPRAQGENASR
ncbi:DUF2269 family protein [Halomonas sp. AOP13-D3-9]